MKKMSKSKFHILPNYEQTNLKTAIVAQDFISRNFGEFQGEISLCCVLFSCLFFYPLALGIEQGNGMSARYVRILFGIKGDTFTPLSF